MANIASLPEELLMFVFKGIQPKKQLAECRLVCSRWNIVARRVLFKNTIVFNSNKKVLALYAQLVLDPSLGRLIRHIHFENTFDAFWMFDAILDKALNVETFEGTLSKPDFFRQLLAAANKSPSPFKNLKKLPQYTEASAKAYFETLLRFRRTITEISIGRFGHDFNGMRTILLEQLNTFDKLTSLSYCGNFYQLSYVDSLLQRCTHLKKLSLKGAIVDRAINEAALDAWMTRSVAKVETLEELTVGGLVLWKSIVYLIFKYPNVKKLSFDVISLETSDTNLGRLRHIIEGLANKCMLTWTGNFLDMLRLENYFGKQGCKTLVDQGQQEPFKTFSVEIGKL